MLSLYRSRLSRSGLRRWLCRNGSRCWFRFLDRFGLGFRLSSFNDGLFNLFWFGMYTIWLSYLLNGCRFGLRSRLADRLLRFRSSSNNNRYLRLNGFLDRLRLNFLLLLLTFYTFYTLILNTLLLQETEDIVEDKVTGRLLSKEEGLHKLPPGLTTV